IPVPSWLPLLWTIPLALVVSTAPRMTSVVGTGAVLGSLAASLTWSADMASRIERTELDISRLGLATEPLAEPLLRELSSSLDPSLPLETAADLHALWRGSTLEQRGFPAHLALWDAEGRLVAELPMDSLALSREMTGAIAHGLPPGETREVRTVHAVPGIHYVLTHRIGAGRLLTVAVGPRTVLIAPDRVGRLLAGTEGARTDYTLTLGSPLARAGPQSALEWRRVGWSLRAERAIALPGGAREVQARVELADPAPLAVRGILVLLFDSALLAVLVLLAGALFAPGQGPRPAWRRVADSFRLRLALALAGFFVLPTVAFAAWSFSHFGDEAERGRDLLIAQTLRDAAQGAGGPLRTPGVPLTEALRRLSERVDADLALYRGGALVATSAPLLQELGVVPPLMDPSAFQSLALDGEVEATRDGVMPELAERVGYRVIEFAPSGGIGVLATPQVSGMRDPGDQQFDLALVLLLATIAGILAAVAGAGVASRALSRPVADLRRAAFAIGRGQQVPLPAATPPVEFEPVFGAFHRMAADVRASQQALEESRRRTAAVLATVATGVVALDPDGRVLIANRQAAELLDSALPEGTAFADVLPASW